MSPEKISRIILGNIDLVRQGERTNNIYCETKGFKKHSIDIFGKIENAVSEKNIFHLHTSISS